MLPNLGGSELIVILLIFVLLFGASKLPALGRSMGQSITNFKKGMDEAKNEGKAEELQARSETVDEKITVNGVDVPVNGSTTNRPPR
jgi:sec-independent protein translocase protein TatA